MIRSLTLGAAFLMLLMLMLPNLIWYAHRSDLQTAIEALFIPAALLLAFFVLLGDRPWLAYLILTPFMLLAPVEAYYVAIYHHPTSAEIIGTLVATNPRETREYLGPALIPIVVALMAAVAMTSLGIWRIARLGLCWRNQWRTRALIVLIATPLTTMAVAMVSTNGTVQQRVQDATNLASTFVESIEPGYPFGLIQRIGAYHREWIAMRTQSARLDGFHFHAKRVTQVHKRQVYVLVIGESSRRSHWQLFGYPRPTNPELSHMGNLVLIGNMLTSWPNSLQAIPLAVTRKPITSASPTFDEASILRAMQEAGYETYWISNQLAIGKFDSPVSMYAYQAQHVKWLNHASWTAPGSYDEDLLQPLSDALADSKRDQFIVLHMMGSHTNYDFRYPRSFKYFRPTMADSENKVPSFAHQQNSYDNTILYTDHVLAGAISILRQSGAMTALWYESDHGEMLSTPTCSFSGHGLGTRYEFEVPAFFWYSDEYSHRFPERVATLVSHAGKPTLSASTFESLIDMAGVDFSGHDESWSLFNHNWRYRQRIVHSYWQADFDSAVFGKNCPMVLPKNSLDLPSKSSEPQVKPNSTTLPQPPKTDHTRSAMSIAARVNA
ncbi:sulfatase-like hydrolase/transferase [Rhodanobacter sp. Col0626]|uniref:phosphoethanolamine transferase n=1 Tax=Rhodanobacter sp. Col0626 TaxID=3415679 RepID=UPI003CEC989B